MFLVKTISEYYEQKYINMQNVGSKLDFIQTKVGSGITLSKDYYLILSGTGTSKIVETRKVASLENAYSIIEGATELKIEIFKGNSASGLKILEGKIDSEGKVNWSNEVTSGTGDSGETPTPDPDPEPEPETYTVTFYDSDKSTVLGTKTAEENTSIGSGNMPTNPTKTADSSYTYEFAGWKTVVGDNEFTGSTTVTANIGVYAEYTATARLLEVNSAYSAYFGKIVTGYDGYTAYQSTDVWRLFYADSNYAYLISDSIGDQRLDTQSGFGGDMTSNDFALGRNLNPKYTTTGNWALKTDGTNINNNIKGVAGLLDTTKWINYANSSKGAQWAIGAPTVEMFIASYNATHTTQLDSTVESATSTGYKVKKGSGNFDTYVTGLGNTADLDKAIYCPSSGYWWLASPSAYISNRVMLVSSSSSGNLNDNGCYFSSGVRPLVSVPISNIGTAGQNKTITITDNYFNN